jgi:hypothetical protein
MLIKLHSQATTTPKIRAAIQASDEPAWVLAERYGTTEQTVWKWRKRDSVEDRSHTPHRLQTTLTPAQERSHRHGHRDAAEADTHRMSRIFSKYAGRA